MFLAPRTFLGTRAPHFSFMCGVGDPRTTCKQSFGLRSKSRYEWIMLLLKSNGGRWAVTGENERVVGKCIKLVAN